MYACTCVTSKFWIAHVHHSHEKYHTGCKKLCKHNPMFIIRQCRSLAGSWKPCSALCWHFPSKWTQGHSHGSCKNLLKTAVSIPSCKSNSKQQIRKFSNCIQLVTIMELLMMNGSNPTVSDVETLTPNFKDQILLSCAHTFLVKVLWRSYWDIKKIHLGWSYPQFLWPQGLKSIIWY